MTQESNGPGDIAIIGCAGQFPGAPDVNSFWKNIKNGVESIRTYTREELVAGGSRAALVDHPSYVKAFGSLDAIDRFDAEFFAYSPREAEMMDPQHRLLLACAVHALENAGYAWENHTGHIGIVAGGGTNLYLMNVIGQRAAGVATDPLQLMVSLDKDHMATKVAYKLGLRGPALNVQTACSTSLVAVHLACQSLLNGETDLCLAGGVSVKTLGPTGYMHVESSIASPDGHCRPFDAAAAGTVFGDGLGLVVLKRLDEARQDRDHILAVIRATAINNDGNRKVGYTAPSVEGQVDVISEALAVGNVDPTTIGYVEAHGTGTALGDPIEMTALKSALRPAGSTPNPCVVGSVKSNVGHLDAAAGVAGLIKAAMVLKEKVYPPTLHFCALNPEIDFSKTGFRVNNELQEWAAAKEPRRAAVSSFGIGGTNAHVVLQEAPPPQPNTPSPRQWQVIPVSAKSPTALAHYVDAVWARIENDAQLDLADAAFTFALGRNEYQQRQALVCSRTSTGVRRRLVSRTTSGTPRPVFLFTGQGAQYQGMAAVLYQSNLVFRQRLDECCALAEAHGKPIRAYLLLQPQVDAVPVDTQLAQMALFATEYAAASMWMAYGVSPEAMIGHSVGEYVAAHLAGVLSLDDAVRVLVTRGELMARCQKGKMLACASSEKVIAPQMGGELEIAAVNGPHSCVVAGSEDAVLAFRERLAGQGIESTTLATSRAFHSRHMDAILGPLREVLGRVRLNAPARPFLSNLSGTWITDEQACSPDYWVQHARQTVRFADCVSTVLDSMEPAWLELGPGGGLLAQVRSQLHEPEKALLLRTFAAAHQTSEAEEVSVCLATLWANGVAVDWSALFASETRRRVPLPSYPFAATRHWLGAVSKAEEGGKAPGTPGPSVDADAPEASWRAIDGRAEGGLEYMLLGLCRMTLGVPELGAEDNLYDKGLDSLTALRLFTKLKEVLQFQAPVRELFEATSVSQLAGLLRERLPAAKVQQLSRISEQARTLSETLEAQKRYAELSEQQLGIRRFGQVEERIALMDPRSPAEIQHLYSRRRSVRTFSAREVSRTHLGALLACLRQARIQGRIKYLYPSAGGLYPVQTYLYAKPSRVEGLQGGIYYYDPATNTLVPVSECGTLNAEIHTVFPNQPAYESSAFSVFFIAQLAAIEPKYGARSKEFCKVEAGAMAQLLATAAEDNELGVCNIGWLHFHQIEKLFKLDPSHWLVHSLIGGHLAEQKASEPPVVHSSADMHYEEGEV